MLMEGIPFAWLEFSAEGVVALVVLLILTDKLRPARRADRELAVLQTQITAVEKQRDDAIEASREAHEVSRIHAETIRDLTDAVDRLANGQEVVVNLTRAALPSPLRGAHE